VQPENLPLGQQATPARILDWRPNQISVEAAGPGLLVLSEVAYPGWRAYIDGKQVQLPVDGLLRSVAIGPGTHDVKVIFFPTSVYVGLAIFIIGLLLVMLSTRIAPLTPKPR
jgi:uncharacterized membrane protein YfhO